MSSKIIGDYRFFDLVLILKDKHLARGHYEDMLDIALEYWRKNKERIPKDIWAREKLSEALIDAGFIVWDAENNGYLFVDAEIKFDWLRKCKEAGKQGGIIARENKRNKENQLVTNKGTLGYPKGEVGSCSETYLSSSSSSSSSFTFTDTYKKNINTNTFKSNLNMYDFEEIYKIYPRKQGKKKGIDKCKVIIKTRNELEELRKAVMIYSSHCQRQCLDMKYIKQFDTFLGSYKDVLDPDWGTSSIKPDIKRMGASDILRRIEEEERAMASIGILNYTEEDIDDL